MSIKRLLQLLPLLGLLAQGAVADEAAIKKSLQENFPGIPVDSVVKTTHSGLYEVVVGDRVIYADEGGNFIFDGHIINVKTKLDMTEERLQKLSAVKFDSLPLDSAIKIVKGNGKRKLAIFSDADCPYCKKLEQDMLKITDVTIYILLYPIDTLHPQSAEKSKTIWCAADRVKAWNDWMLKGSLPKNKSTCDNPIGKLQALGQKLKVNGTPTLIFADGRRVPGAIPAAQIEKFLSAAEGK